MCELGKHGSGAVSCCIQLSAEAAVMPTLLCQETVSVTSDVSHDSKIKIICSSLESLPVVGDVTMSGLLSDGVVAQAWSFAFVRSVSLPRQTCVCDVQAQRKCLRGLNF